jgi:RNA polymerase subunit RPABC4/transcription elongation factor Spt4
MKFTLIKGNNMDKVYCDNCNWIGERDEVLRVRCGYVFDDAVDVCPECNHAETISSVKSLWRKRQIDQRSEEIPV